MNKSWLDFNRTYQRQRVANPRGDYFHVVLLAAANIEAAVILLQFTPLTNKKNKFYSHYKFYILQPYRGVVNTSCL